MRSRVRLPSPDISSCSGFALRANSLGHLEQIESHAPGRQVRFGSLNYKADIRGDLILDGFEPLPCAPHNRDEQDVTLPSDSVREIASAATPVVNPEQIAPSESRGIDPTMEAALSVALEPDTDFTPFESRVAEPLDLSPATDSEPPTSVLSNPTGTDHGIHLNGYLSALALGRRAKFAKISLPIRRLFAKLCPA